MTQDRSNRGRRSGAWLAATLLLALACVGVWWMVLHDSWSDETVHAEGIVSPARSAEREVPAVGNDGAVNSTPRPGDARIAQRAASTSTARPTNPLDGLRAFRYLEQICDIGPRASGSAGMAKQQELLREHFEKLGGKVTLQEFQANNPLGGVKVQLANLLVEWHPERRERILLCAHYDTRPLPDRDPNPALRRTGTFIGANDGASGVAVLMELAHFMPELQGDVGVDFALFDGEELVYVDQRDPYFLGSTWFARQYAQNPPPHKYRWGVLLDMVGDRDLQIYQEQHSIAWRDTRPLVKEIWATAGRLGVKEFVPRAGYEILDDHLPLRNIGKIPTCDIIDAPQSYIYWHTTMDTPQRCAPASLAKVGWVVYEWLKTQN